MADLPGTNPQLQQKIINSLAPKSPDADLAQIAAQQIKGISKPGIPPTLAAKYVGRAQYVASRMGQSLPANLVNTAKTFNHPEIGYSMMKDPAAQQAFIKQAGQVIKGMF